jgi:hypothetical protein
MASYTTTWNDDDRDISDMPIYTRKTYKIDKDKFIPIRNILKELYDEEKEALYINCDSSNNYSVKNNYAVKNNYNEYDQYYSDNDYDSSDEDESNIEINDTDFFENLVYNKFCYY